MSTTQMVKIIDDFINDNEIKLRLFGTKVPELTMNFGNPHDFTEEELEDIRNVVEDSNIIISKPVKVRAYNPRSSTVSSLGDKANLIKEEIETHLRTISPFPINQHTIEGMNDKIYMNKGSANSVLKTLLSFSAQELCGMSEELKVVIINNSMKSIEEAFDTNKNCLFHKGFTFWDDFEENKLKYLVDSGEEPIVFREEDYLFLKNGYLKVMRAALESLFYQAYTQEKGKLKLEERDGDESFYFRLECSKRFQHLNRGVISSLAYQFISDGLYLKNENDIDYSTYHSFTLCPLTEKCKDIKDFKEGWHFEHFIEEVAAIEPSRLSKLLKVDDYIYFLNEVTKYLKFKLNLPQVGITPGEDKLLNSIRKNISDKPPLIIYQQLFFHYQTVSELMLETKK